MRIRALVVAALVLVAAGACSSKHSYKPSGPTTTVEPLNPTTTLPPVTTTVKASKTTRTTVAKK